MVDAPRFNKRSPRIDIRHSAALVDSGGTEHQVVILDISSGGFRLEISEPLRIGEFVSIRAASGECFDAQIRWALGAEAGVFLTPVDYSALS